MGVGCLTVFQALTKRGWALAATQIEAAVGDGAFVKSFFALAVLLGAFFAVRVITAIVVAVLGTPFWLWLSSKLGAGMQVGGDGALKPGGAGLTLLSVASKLIAEPVRAVPLACFLIYCQQLFLAEGQLLPGPSALALDGATWVEVRDLSLNFWEIGPALFPGFPVVHPGLEGIFNVVLAWSALFVGFAADGRKPSSSPSARNRVASSCN